MRLGLGGRCRDPGWAGSPKASAAPSTLSLLSLLLSCQGLSGTPHSTGTAGGVWGPETPPILHRFRHTEFRHPLASPAQCHRVAAGPHAWPLLEGSPGMLQASPSYATALVSKPQAAQLPLPGTALHLFTWLEAGAQG